MVITLYTSNNLVICQRRYEPVVIDYRIYKFFLKQWTTYYYKPTVVLQYNIGTHVFKNLKYSLDHYQWSTISQLQTRFALCFHCIRKLTYNNLITSYVKHTRLVMKSFEDEDTFYWAWPSTETTCPSSQRRYSAKTLRSSKRRYHVPLPSSSVRQRSAFCEVDNSRVSHIM